MTITDEERIPWDIKAFLLSTINVILYKVRQRMLEIGRLSWIIGIPLVGEEDVLVTSESQYGHRCRRYISVKTS